MKSELYDKLGTKQGVHRIAHHFYVNFLKDDLLRPFFESIDIDQQERKMHAFLTYAFGGNSLYTGKTLRRAHSGLVINQGLSTLHFDAMMACMAQTLKEQKIAAELIQEVITILEYQRNNILGVD
jgi:hemoglobin